MRPIESLRMQLRGLDGKDYGACQSLLGSYSYPTFDLYIDQIPKDPYAPPHTGIYRVRVGWSSAGFSPNVISTQTRKVALRDFLARQFFRNSSVVSRRRGTGNSGLITIAEPGQEILERTSVAVSEEFIEARIFLGLPAQNRRIRADVAEQMIFEELPGVVNSSLFASSLDGQEITEHLHTAEDAEFLRNELTLLGLVAFVADDAVLPRVSGVDPRPLDSGDVVRFRSPDSLRLSVELPNAGTITGMGIPKGVTLLVGGGYHGKSTLLQALEQGVYNHIAGDGRESCVSLPETVKVRAYSGRSVVNTDISPFIENIPRQHDTVAFY
jgi:predicted ABC-class ATPase